MTATPTVDRPTVAIRFLLDADADAAPGLLSRLLQPFAKRDLIPDRMWSHRAGATLHIEIAMAAMPCDVVHLIAGNLGQVVGVRSIAEGRSSPSLVKFSNQIAA
jgi:hypothetical protein